MGVGLLVPSFRIKAILTEPFAVVDTYSDVGHRFGYGRCDSSGTPVSRCHDSDDRVRIEREDSKEDN